MGHVLALRSLARLLVGHAGAALPTPSTLHADKRVDGLIGTAHSGGGAGGSDSSISTTVGVVTSSSWSACVSAGFGGQGATEGLTRWGTPTGCANSLLAPAVGASSCFLCGVLPAPSFGGGGDDLTASGVSTFACEGSGGVPW